MRIERDQVRTLIVVAFLAIGFVAGIWWPQHVARKHLIVRINEARVQLHDAAAAHHDIRQWYHQIARMRRRLRYFPGNTPGQNHLARILRSLSQALESAGISDQEVTTRPAGTRGRFAVIPIQVRFRGSFPAAYQVLQQIETTRGLLRVDDLQIHQPGPGRKNRSLMIQLQLSAFFASDQERN